MSSFQIAITPSRRAAARFIAQVRRTVQKVLAEEEAEDGIRQADIARSIGVHRSVIHREIRGHKDLTLGRLAEIAWALGREPTFDLSPPVTVNGANAPAATDVATSVKRVTVVDTSAAATLVQPAPGQSKVVVLATSNA
jgi:plasmid maintenance system antidote protein VapI